MTASAWGHRPNPHPRVLHVGTTPSFGGGRAWWPVVVALSVLILVVVVLATRTPAVGAGPFPLPSPRPLSSLG